MAKEKARVKRREKKNIASGVAHVNASFNNTMITITDAQGNRSPGLHRVRWVSRGRGNQLPMPLKLRQRMLVAKPRNMGCDDRNRGEWAGVGARISIARVAGLRVPGHFDLDVTPIPHNGCRPRKRRRV